MTLLYICNFGFVFFPQRNIHMKSNIVGNNTILITEMFITILALKELIQALN